VTPTYGQTHPNIYHLWKEWIMSDEKKKTPFLYVIEPVGAGAAPTLGIVMAVDADDARVQVARQHSDGTVHIRGF